LRLFNKMRIVHFAVVEKSKQQQKAQISTR